MFPLELHTCPLGAVFILCGSPTDLKEVKNISDAADNLDILFILIDLYKSVKIFLNLFSSFDCRY